jgi:hypothetical protein
MDNTEQQGRILHRGSCECGQEVLVIEYEGEDRRHLMHKQPTCDRFKEGKAVLSEGLTESGFTPRVSRKQRRAAESLARKKTKSTKRRGRR